MPLCIQALVHLLSATDEAKILISREKEILQKMSVFKQFHNVAMSQSDIEINMVMEKSDFVSNTSNNHVETVKSRIEDDVKAEEDSQGMFAERPVITFDANLSHLQLTPQRDVQVSWTVEFWLKREDPTVSDSETDSESVSIPGVDPGSGNENHPIQSPSNSIGRSIQQHASTIRDYAAALSEGLGLGLGLRGIGNFLPPIPNNDSRPLRSLLGTRPVNSLSSSMRGSSSKTQASLSKLSRILGSDFGILGSSSDSNSGPSLWGWDQERESLGQEINLNDEIDREGNNRNEEETGRGGGEEAEANDDNRHDEKDDDEYGRRKEEEEEKQRGDASWTFIPPAAAMDPQLSLPFGADEFSSDDVQNINRLRLNQMIASTQQYDPGYEEESMSNPDACTEANRDVRAEANRALLAVLERVSGFEGFDRIVFPGSDEVEGRELGKEFSEELGRIEGGDAIDQLINRQNNLFHGMAPELMDDIHAELEVQGPSQSQSETSREIPRQSVAEARTSTSTSTGAIGPSNTNLRRRNSVSLSQSTIGNMSGKENERERDERKRQSRDKKEMEVNREGEEMNEKSNEKFKENEIEKEKEINISPIYLLSSPGGHIKLQLGGRIYKENDINDPQQKSNPIESQAYCISIGQRGATEKSFDYIVPKNKWVHLSITCCVGGNSVSGPSSSSSSVVTIYENGELKDFQTMRCNLPIGTFGIQKKSHTFLGHLSEMRVWNYARTALEIQRDLYTDVSGMYKILEMHFY